MNARARLDRIEKLMTFQTPPWCCDYMARLVPSGHRRVLEPTPGQGNLVRALQQDERRLHVIAPERFEDIQAGDRFSAVVMNPPFTPMSRGYEILAACMELAPFVIALMPWLVLINSEARTRAITEYGLRVVHHLPRSTFPGARVQTCILEMRHGFGGTTQMEFVARPVEAL